MFDIRECAANPVAVLIKSLGIESLPDFVHFVTKADYEAELKTCLAASPELAETEWHWHA